MSLMVKKLTEEEVAKRHTCVSLDCPFIFVCKEYNYLIDRGSVCKHAEHYLKLAKMYEKSMKKR